MDTAGLSTDQFKSILDQPQNGVSLFDFDKLSATFMPFMIGFTILSVAITVIYIVHLVQKMRIDKAILETRDIVREINEREKAKLNTQLPKSAELER